MTRKPHSYLAFRIQQPARRVARSRRGALLLVVLSMLVLFAMIGVTFVVAAAHFRRAADASLRAEPVEWEGSSDADAAMHSLLRGPTVGTTSPLMGNEVLRDMYGGHTILVTRSDVIDFPSPQMMRIRVEAANFPMVGGQPRFSVIQDYYSGTLLTFTTGAAARQTHRIMRYRPHMNGDVLERVDFIVDREPESPRRRLVNSAGNQMAQAMPVDSFIINGHAFSGTGYGYQPPQPGQTTRPGLTLRTRGVGPGLPTQPVALLPNIAYTFPGGIEPLSGIPIEAGGANESYTAPDYQNMYLAYIPLDAGANPRWILPSFHRPDLMDYWARQMAQDDDEFDDFTNQDHQQRRNAFRDPTIIPDGPPDSLRYRVIEMLRRISLRPLRVDNPTFSGSNPSYDPFGINGQYDVDNDLDGTPESVWIDPGLPIKTDSQGRRYRTMVAVLIRDMDGLLDINAHGFYSHLAGFNNADPNVGNTPAQVQHNRPESSPAWQTGNMNPVPMRLPLGSGYGPADVNLMRLFSADAGIAAATTRQIFQNRYANRANPGEDVPVARPGFSGMDDPLSRMANLGIPNFNAEPMQALQFGTPPDRLGHGFVYLDYEGKPRWMQLQDSSGFQQTMDDPYEANLLRPEASDHHFTYQDLERMLRYEEYDSSQLQSGDERLLMATANTLGTGNPNPADAARRRRLLRISGYQHPGPARAVVPRDGYQDGRLTGAGESPTLATLLHERIEAANPGWSEQEVNQAMLALLPPELLKGEKLDLNRLLEAPPTKADGAPEDVFTLAAKAIEDYQSSYADRGAYAVGSRFTSGSRQNVLPYNLPRPLGWETPNPGDPTSYSASRQLMARHLYVLMLLVTDPQYIHPAIDQSGSLSAEQQRELTLRRIAQWAVNVVDFRDKDGIMTPFEYDLNPFFDSMGNGTTWNVDGNLGSNEGAWRRVVWGTEAPDLILTETLAFHDRGTRDTEWDSGPGEKRNDPNSMDHEPTLDQYRKPEGSLFMEFYNPRNTTNTSGTGNSPASALPQDLYDINPGSPTYGQLHLNRVAPGGYPVWRVVISSTELDGDRQNVINQMAERPDTINFQPRDPNSTADPSGFSMLGTGPSLEDYEIERIVYFANVGDTNPALVAPNVFFYRGGSDLGIHPGQYFVVGPRQRTVIGSKPHDTEPEYNTDGSQAIVLSGENSGTFTFPGMPWYPSTEIKPFLGIAVTSNFPNTNDPNSDPALDPEWDTIEADIANDPTNDPDGPPFGIGLNISEPLASNYYDRPTELNEYTLPQRINLYGLPGGVELPPIPFDTDPNRNFPLGNSPELAQTGTFPNKDDLNNASFIQGYKTAILQRLANPLSPFDAVFNPYISVDAMPIDLTVYTGEDNPGTNADPAVTAEAWDPDELGEDPRNIDVPFASRERGRRGNPELNQAPNSAMLEFEGSYGNLAGIVSRVGLGLTNLLQTLNQTPPHWTAPRDLPDEHFGRRLRHTLGYVNHSYGSPMGPNYGGPADPAYLGSPQPLEQRPSDPYDPTSAPHPAPLENNPFGWLQWSNRPYVSEYELMQVPSSSPQRLLYEYSYKQRFGGTDVDPYARTTGGDNQQSLRAPYGHLLNFFHTSDNTLGDGNVGNNGQGGQFARLFDYVHVPSAFNNTYKWMSPVDPGAAQTLNPDYNALGVNDPRIGYQFPFNKRSMFREPGKINLNTIPANEVYSAIFDPDLWGTGAGINFPTWEQFQQSRRGFVADNNPEFPSRFSNPFRTAATAEMMPELGNPATPDNRLRVPPPEATIMRSRRGTNLPAADRTPLFDYRLEDTQPASMHRHHNPHANPMFRYQAYQRLGNIAGTQSNVFAVWITVGYFELEPTQVSAIHPDGWRLGEEMGMDTGNIRRHRAFYIIDRSIPVGYEPGQDHNVEDVIQLRRFIE